MWGLMGREQQASELEVFEEQELPEMKPMWEQASELEVFEEQELPEMKPMWEQAHKLVYRQRTGGLMGQRFGFEDQAWINCRLLC